MSLEKYLRELSQGAMPVKHAGLLRLSGLAPEEADLFRREWAGLDVQRKRGIVTRLVETADDNVEVDFNAVFRHCLTDPDGTVRQKAILGLWESDDRTLIQPLLKLMEEDSEDEVRAMAAQALGKFAVLAEEGKLLPRDGERVHEALLRTLQDDKEAVEVRRRALEGVAPFNAPRVVDIIQWAYGHADPRMRQSAVHAMGRNGDPQWLETILRELQSDAPAMRYEAAHACGEMGDEEAVPHLVPLTRDDDPQVQVAAIRALGMIGGRLARRVLLKCAGSEDEVVRDAAQDALRMMDTGEGPSGFCFER